MLSAEEKLGEICDMIVQYNVDGPHHKQWVLTEVLKIALGEPEFWAYVSRLEADGDVWDMGIPP